MILIILNQLVVNIKKIIHNLFEPMPEKKKIFSVKTSVKTLIFVFDNISKTKAEQKKRIADLESACKTDSETCVFFNAVFFCCAV